MQLKREILSVVPDADIVGHVGRSASFEVTIDGTLVYSKLSKRSFPNFSAVVDSVRTANESGEAKPVTEVQEEWCTLL
eukprot:m.31442 g.31442  ORF g.31442 m.31442 type:complete len:78 (-) comp14761_c0_seq1:258-491(-)